jgi:hypothetical protein
MHVLLPLDSIPTSKFRVSYCEDGAGIMAFILALVCDDDVVAESTRLNNLQPEIKYRRQLNISRSRPLSLAHVLAGVSPQCCEDN